MPDLNGRDLLHEWRQLMDAVIASASSAAGRRDLPGELLGSMQRQLELVQEVVERERRLQGDLAARLLAPVDAVFDLLEQTGATLRQQAEALQTAGRALEESAGLMKSQAELFERTIAALREPAERARVAAGLERRGGKARKQAPRS
jgi:Zn-dependent M28 family amino/carboxypeptidase